MDIIIIFFRDILSGPLYIIVSIVNSILICSCIGYLGEQYLNKRKIKEMSSVNAFNVPLGNGSGNVEIDATANLVNSNSQVNNNQNSSIE